MSQTAPALTPRAEAKRAQIRAAAQQLFLEGGYAGTSTDAIARAAGVSKETLYRHYPSKDELLTDVLRHFFNAALPADLSLELHGMDDLRATLERLVRSVLAHIMTPAYIGLLRVIVSEAPHAPQLADIFRASVPVRGMDLIGGLLRAAHERGLIPALDFETATRMLIGSVLTYAILDGLFAVNGPPRVPGEERQRAIVGLFLKAIS